MNVLQDEASSSRQRRHNEDITIRLANSAMTFVDVQQPKLSYLVYIVDGNIKFNYDIRKLDIKKHYIELI